MTKIVGPVLTLLLVSACFVIVRGELPADSSTGEGDGHGDGHGGDHGVDHGGDHGGDHDGSHGLDACICTRNEYFVEASLNRTCTQELLREVQYALHYISQDVKHVVNATHALQYGLTQLSAAHATSTSELKYQLTSGFDLVAQKIAETNELIRSELANVVAEQQRSIYSLRQVVYSFASRNIIEYATNAVQ